MPSLWNEFRILTYKMVRRLYSKREGLSTRYLHGSGIEIGALAHPLSVRPDVEVKYLDKVDRAELLRMNPNLDASRVVTPDIIDDGFTLSKVQDGSQDFIIANHVLEHTPNPIQALVEWSRVIRPGGILYVSVPIASLSFDVGRPLTTIEHFLDDYRLSQRQAWAELDKRNRDHIAEWVNISELNIKWKIGSNNAPPPPEELLRMVQQVNIATLNELHYHTFSFETFHDLLNAFTTSINPACELKVLENNFTELIAIISKKDGAA
jgi:SAM-dependent methyltransferase